MPPTPGPRLPLRPPSRAATAAPKASRLALRAGCRPARGSSNARRDARRSKAKADAVWIPATPGRRGVQAPRLGWPGAALPGPPHGIEATLHRFRPRCAARSFAPSWPIGPWKGLLVWYLKMWWGGGAGPIVFTESFGDRNGRPAVRFAPPRFRSMVAYLRPYLWATRVPLCIAVASLCPRAAPFRPPIIDTPFLRETASAELLVVGLVVTPSWPPVRRAAAVLNTRLVQSIMSDLPCSFLPPEHSPCRFYTGPPTARSLSG